MGQCFLKITDIYAPIGSTPATEDQNYPDLRHLLMNRAQGIKTRAKIFRDKLSKLEHISCDYYGFESLSGQYPATIAPLQCSPKARINGVQIDTTNLGEQEIAEQLIDGSDSLSAQQKQQAKAAVVEFYGHVKTISDIAAGVAAMHGSSMSPG